MSCFVSCNPSVVGVWSSPVRQTCVRAHPGHGRGIQQDWPGRSRAEAAQQSHLMLPFIIMDAYTGLRASEDAKSRPNGLLQRQRLRPGSNSGTVGGASLSSDVSCGVRMVIRVISFLCGGLFGTGGAVLVFRFVEHAPVHWGIVGLAAIVMGSLAALFGRKFWDTAVGLWP